MDRFSLFRNVLVAVIVLVSLPLSAQRKITIGYQGVIESNGDILDNTRVLMKFALCNEECDTVFWSNDGTSATGEEPDAEVFVPVVGGVFNVLLGDDSVTNMDTISATIFEQVGEQDLYLRVWLDDGIYGFEQLYPDQLVAVVPFAVRAISSGEMVGSMTVGGDMRVTTTATGTSDGVVFDASTVTDGTGVLIEVDALGSAGLAFEINDPTRTLFSVDENGSAFSRDILLKPLTSSSDLARFSAGRIFYDGTSNVFKACTNTSCSQIAIAGADGVADITSVTAGTGLSGGGTSGAVTLTVDTSVVVTKTGDHTMTGALTAGTLSGTTVSATTTNTTDLTATGTVSAVTLSVSGATTATDITATPTGTAAGDTADLAFRELAANGTQSVGFKAPDSIILSRIWTLPTGDGTANQVLQTNGSGVLSWGADDDSGGDITAVTAGLGLSGGAISGTASLNVDPGTGIQVNADSVQLSYAETLAGDPALLSGEAVFDSADSQGGLLFEGDTANGFELLLTVTEPTADRTVTIPNETGTICTTGSVCSGYQASATALTTSTSWGGDLTGTGASPTLASNSVDGSNIAVGSDATGDILYYNGTDYVRLGIGSANQLLQTNSGQTAPEWVSGDHQVLSNRTRSGYLPAQLFSQSNGTAMSLAFIGTYPDRYEEWPFVTAPATDPQAISTSWQVPQDWASGTSLGFYVYFTQSGTDAATWRCEMNFASIANAESAVSASTTVAASITPDGSTTSLQIDACGSSSTNVAAGEWLRINLERDSAHADDTNGDSIQIVGLEVRYTADM